MFYFFPYAWKVIQIRSRHKGKKKGDQINDHPKHFSLSTNLFLCLQDTNLILYSANFFLPLLREVVAHYNPLRYA